MRTRKLKEYSSSLVGKIVVWQKPNGDKLLTTNDFSQGISADSKQISDSYWYYQAQQILKHSRKIKHPEILWLGLGAGTGPTLVAKENPTINQTAIEFDPYIIKAAKEFFLPKSAPNLTVIQADAYEEVERLRKSKKKFDAIAVDIYINDDPLNGKKLTEYDFLKSLPAILRPKGILVFNRLAHKEEERGRTKKFLNKLEEMFGDVESLYIKDSRGYENEVITVSTK